MNEQIKKILIAAGGIVIAGGAAAGGAKLSEQPCEVRLKIEADVVCMTQTQFDVAKAVLLSEQPGWATALGVWDAER